MHSNGKWDSHNNLNKNTPGYAGSNILLTEAAPTMSAAFCKRVFKFLYQLEKRASALDPSCM